jgi:hypothetical protein
MKLKELYAGMIEKMGIKHQCSVCIEELSELTKTLTKVLRDKGNQMKVCEELADVTVCVEEMRQYFDPKGEYVRLFRRYKTQRLRTFYLEGKET